MKLRQVTTCFFLLGMILVIGCGSDDGGGILPPPSNNDQLLATETIGADGGTITGGELSITIPSGAFSTSRELKIYNSGDDQPFGSAALSPLYLLDGLPTTFSQPLAVSFPTSSKEDAPMIALGETSFSSSEDGMVTGYRILKTSNSGSTVVAHLPAAPDPVDDGGQGFSIKLVNLAGYSAKSGNPDWGVRKTSTEHFDILHIGMIEEATRLGASLEAAFNKIQLWGFNYDRRTNWPVEVAIFDLKENQFGVFVPSMWGDNYGILNFNALRIDEIDEFKVTPGHEFFHLVQALYDNRNRYNKSKFVSDRYWLDEAVSVWSERDWSGDSDYLSAFVRGGHEHLPFQKFHVASNGDQPNYHGYGMSALIQYIQNHYSSTTLGEIYDSIFANGNDPVAAVNAVLGTQTGEPFTEWHPEFLKELIQGELYGDVGIATAMAYDTATWDIDDANDTQQSYSYSYGPGSARFYILKLTHTGFTPETNLTLDLDFPTGKIVVYRIDQSSLIHMAEGTNLVIQGLDDLVATGQYLMVMVTNELLGPNYNYDTNLVLDLKISETPGFKNGYIWVGGPATYSIHETNTTGLDTTYVRTDIPFQMQGGISLNPVPGLTVDETFTATYNSLGTYDSNHNYSGTISISMNNPDDPTLITAFNLSGVITRLSGDVVEAIDTYSCTGSGIPQYYGINGSYSFKITGTDAASHVLEAERVMVDYGGFHTEENTWTLIDFSPDYIVVELNR